MAPEAGLRVGRDFEELRIPPHDAVPALLRLVKARTDPRLSWRSRRPVNDGVFAVKPRATHGNHRQAMGTLRGIERREERTHPTPFVGRVRDHRDGENVPGAGCRHVEQSQTFRSIPLGFALLVIEKLPGGAAGQSHGEDFSIGIHVA